MVLGRMIDIVLAVAAATWIALAGVTGEVRAAAYDTSRLDRMPDFSQTDRRLGLPNGGSKYCVPVATANVLVWLAEQRGYKKLLPVRGVEHNRKGCQRCNRIGQQPFDVHGAERRHEPAKIRQWPVVIHQAVRLSGVD